MKFDFIIMNPPFNNATSSTTTSKRKRMTKKIHLSFFEQSFNDSAPSSKITAICPATKWWVGGCTEKARTYYTNLGMQKAVNADNSPEARKKGLVFAKANIKNIGIFVLKQGNKILEKDDFNNILPKAKFPITEVFKFFGNAGSGASSTRSKFEHKLKKKGAYKVWSTVSKTNFTNNKDLFKDRSYGYWRVIFNHNYGHDKLGPVAIAHPEDLLSYSVGCFKVSSYEEADTLRNFLNNNDNVKEIFRKLKKSPTNSKFIFSHIDGKEFLKKTELC